MQPSGLAQRLEAIDAALTADPRDVALLYERARIARTLGRTEEARLGFLSVLAHVPTHYGALTDYGVLLHDIGQRDEALRLYREVARLFPARAMARVNLGYLLLQSGDPAAAREHYEAAVAVEPANLEAHQGLAAVLMELGEEQAAAEHRRIAFERRPLRVARYRGRGEPVRVLQLVSAAGGNVPTASFLDDTTFAVTTLAADYYDPAKGLPRHDVVFNAIGDADAACAALANAARLRARTQRPWINDPAAIAATARVVNADRLRALPNVIAPRMALLDGAILRAPSASAFLERLGFRAPLLLRTPGFHTGRYFERVDERSDPAAAIAGFPPRPVLAIEYLDTASPDGLFRKYRVMIAGGELYPLHLAIARHWKVHYATSDMTESEHFRVEEAAFLSDMRGALGDETLATLERIRVMLGLDFGGIDFALDARGHTVVFEANATMNVLDHAHDDRFAYRVPAAERIRAAVREMLRPRTPELAAAG